MLGSEVILAKMLKLTHFSTDHTDNLHFGFHLLYALTNVVGGQSENIKLIEGLFWRVTIK
jgi:hypothetical protein